jgi:kynureninase
MSAEARALDAADPLARFRADFHLPPGQIYFDGNSLGLLSRSAEASLAHTIDQWRTHGIGGWTDAAPPWLTLAETCADKLAPLLGATPDQICVTGQTTANLHQLLATLFNPVFLHRRTILTDALNFPSDTYAIASHLRLRGLNPAATLRQIPSRSPIFSSRASTPRSRPSASKSPRPAATSPAGDTSRSRIPTRGASARP